MRRDLYSESFLQETYYWWHLAKQELVIYLIKKYADNRKIKILDLGCGTGAMLARLKPFGRVYGLDNSQLAVRLCQKRGLKNVSRHNMEQAPLPFSNKQFDVVLALDVIEHIRYPEKVICEVRRILKQNGFFIITVPAYKFLWSYWDVILGHSTRYNKKSILALLRPNGFHPLFVSYFHTLIFIPSILIRLVKQTIYNKTTKSSREEIHSDFIPLPKWLNALLLVVAGLERQILTKVPLPLGLSLITICQKEKIIKKVNHLKT